jgi:hypothetical protein
MLSKQLWTVKGWSSLLGMKLACYKTLHRVLYLDRCTEPKYLEFLESFIVYIQFVHSDITNSWLAWASAVVPYLHVLGSEPVDTIHILVLCCILTQVESECGT